MTTLYKEPERLSEILAPSFYSFHRSVRRGERVHYWLAGGRGSGKSSAASVELLLEIMRHPGANGAALRRWGNQMRESVLDQLVWAAGRLGAGELWEKRLSPMEFIFRPTGQRIFLRGADDPRKLKSLRPEEGYIRCVWYEEADEFGEPERLRSLNQTLLRGGRGQMAFYTFNPPRSPAHWINRELTAAALRKDAGVYRSDYRGMPEGWLGEVFLAEAERLKRERPEAYAHEYLGEAVGTGGEVFTNLVFRNIQEEERKSFCRIKRGIDWGFGADPFVYLAAEYDRKRRRLLIFHEFYKRRAGFDEIARAIRAENPGGEAVAADSADPRANNELKKRGIRIYPAKKGPGSVEHGISWLQNLSEIVIDPERCPYGAKEFMEYSLDPDGEGGFLSGFPDRNNHCIDAARYACEREMRPVGLSF